MVYEAKLADLQTVKNMVHRTIKECYPECFSENVVDFFLNLHSEEAIKDDLMNANVYLMESDGYLVGTGTIKDNVIKRLFILPQYQHHKFGTELLQCLEDELAVNDIFTAAVDAHEQVKGWYQAMGYAVLSEQTVDINGEALPYYHMEKQVTAMNVDNLNQGLMF